MIDNVPRPDGLTEEQADALRRLARQIMILMRERRQLVRLRAEERLTRAASIRRAALIELGDHLRDVASVAAIAGMPLLASPIACASNAMPARSAANSAADSSTGPIRKSPPTATADPTG